VRLLSPIEQAYLNGTREFTKAQQRYIRYRLKKKLRLLDESRDAAAAKLLRLDKLVAGQPGRALPGGCNNTNSEKEGALGGIPDVFRRFRTRDLYLTKVTLYQAELPRQSNGQSSQ
jgi:hypothetical protein